MNSSAEWLGEDISAEFSGAQLGDGRRTKRLQRIARMASSSPGAGFPQMVNSDSELEGLYRFLSNPNVTETDILKPHIESTRRRARESGACLVLHDTTTFSFGGMSRRSGLGATSSGGQGFMAHVALAVLEGDSRIPLGILGQLSWTRTTVKHSERKSAKALKSDEQRESLRWYALLEQIEHQREGFECIHVMDREGDIFELLAQASELGARFVIRAAHDRRIDAAGEKLSGLLNDLGPQLYRNVQVCERLGKRFGAGKSRHKPRDARTAELAIAAISVVLKAPRVRTVNAASVSLNLVRVWEPHPPADQPQIEWLLLTSEPIATDQDLARIVDTYRARWTIEEFFKAIKTGCGFERRQLESLGTLKNALAIFMPIAWRLLLVRAVSRAAPKASPETMLIPIQLRLLQYKLKLTQPFKTAEEAAYGLARLGGHLKRNGPPGWQTLGKGLDRLNEMLEGWMAAEQVLRCDQS